MTSSPAASSAGIGPPTPSSAASSRECIQLLNAGADYYLDAWTPPAELVARIKVVLRVSGWLDRYSVAAPAVAS